MGAATSDVIVIGGGIAGLSAASALAPHARILVLEAEDHIGVHSSGRSATMFHFALGNRSIRALTLSSRPLFDDPPQAFDSAPAHPLPILVHARENELEALAAARDEMALFTAVDELDEAEMAELCPILKIGGAGAVRGLADRKALRIDQHALMQGYVRQIRTAGGRIATGQQVIAIRREADDWRVTTASAQQFSAPLIVNAAGAWADEIARLSGVAPVELRPLRRTIVTFDAPPGIDPASLPFTKTVGDELYFSGESGRLFASPMDEGESPPCDSQPDEIDIATAAFRMEQRTKVSVGRVHARWSGLRTFAPDRVPVIGFAPGANGFMWCAGQGGSGLQTAPAAAAAVAALVLGTAWPVEGVTAAELDPARFTKLQVPDLG